MPGFGFDRMYCVNVFVGEKMYSYSFYENVNKSQETGKAKFFDSFRVK